MINKKLGFGIIGCGFISKWHADSINIIDDAELIGVTNVNELSSKAFAQRYRIKAFNSLDDMLKEDSIQGISICTPSGLHTPLALKIIEAGKNVIIEKPMAINVKDADKIIECAERKNVKVTVISQLRFSDAFRNTKEAIDSGLLGKLIMGDVYMKYYRSQEYYDQAGWRGTWKLDGGGALMNQGIHGVDLLQYLMGPVKSVYGYTKTSVRNIEVEDTAVALLEFKNGSIGVIQAATSIFPGFLRRFEISGNKGSIILEEDSILKWNIEGKDAPENVINSNPQHSSYSDPKCISLDGHIKQISDFIDAIKNNRSPMVDQYEGKKAVEIIMAIYESSKTGKKIIL